MRNWKVISDAKYYSAPFTPKQLPSPYSNALLDKGRTVEGDLVYLRYADKFTPYLKLKKGITNTHKYISLANVSSEEISSFSGNMEEHILAHLDEGEYSNAFGDGIKNWIGKIKQKRISKREAEELSNPMKVEYSEEEARVLHHSSGHKGKFGEWLSSGGATKLLSNLKQFGVGVLVGTEGNSDSSEKITSDDSGDKVENKILGMHPITFSIGAIAVISLVVVGVSLYKSKGAITPVK